MADHARVGTRSDAFMFLASLALLVGAALLMRSGQMEPSLSWFLVLPGAALAFALFERAKGHRWRTAWVYALLACVALAISGLLGYWIDVECGPLRLKPWELVAVLVVWPALTAALFRLERLLFVHLRGRRQASR